MLTCRSLKIIQLSCKEKQASIKTTLVGLLDTDRIGGQEAILKGSAEGVLRFVCRGNRMPTIQGGLQSPRIRNEQSLAV